VAPTTASHGAALSDFELAALPPAPASCLEKSCFEKPCLHWRSMFTCSALGSACDCGGCCFESLPPPSRPPPSPPAPSPPPPAPQTGATSGDGVYDAALAYAAGAGEACGEVCW
jgi:hypothetical protein